MNPPKFTADQKKRLLDALAARGVGSACTVCARSNTILHDEAALIPSLERVDSGLAVVTLVCVNCGHLQHHLLAQLDASIEGEVRATYDAARGITRPPQPAQ